MDELLFDTYIPDPDAPRTMTPTAVPPAQARSSEPARRTVKPADELMLDKLMVDLGVYDLPELTPIAPADTANTKRIEIASAPVARTDEIEAYEAMDAQEADTYHTILGLDERAEEEPELEKAYLRRVARREAQRLEREGGAALSDLEADAPADVDTKPREPDIRLDPSPDEPERSALAERLFAPVVRLLAIQKAKQKLREEEAAIWPAPVDIRQTPELSAVKAAKYYGSHLYPLSVRLYTSLFLTLVLSWIALGLPMAGQLRQSIPMQAAVSLVFLMTNMLCALDVITAGMRQLFRYQPAMEALCVVSCLAACLDALLTTLGIGAALPFCALPSAALTAALWGEKLFCLAQTDNLKTAAAAKGGESSYLCAQSDKDGAGVLLRTRQARDGIVRRSEESDGAQRAYFTAAPLLLIAAVILAVLSTLGQKWTYIFHNLSAYFAVCANVSGFLCFALPYHTASLRLRHIGAAIAGWAGCAEIGRAHRFIVKDSDLFLPGQIRISRSDFPDNSMPGKVISYALSVLNISGSCIADAFAPLATDLDASLLTVTGFQCEEGGFTATIHGESVAVGSKGFMRLKNINLPPNINADNAVYVGISGQLAGVFYLEYKKAKSQRGTMELLLRGRTQPLFALRDFNVTPLILQELFGIPANNFVFPSFHERYRLSSQFEDRDTPPAAVLRCRSLHDVVQAAEQGRKLFVACGIGTTISLLSTLLAMLVVFLTFHAGNFAAVTAGGMLLYSALFALPLLALAFWALL